MDKETKLVHLLMNRGLRISFAESCTAGKAAARLVNAADASRVFDAAFVTYANEAKTEFLGIDPALIAAWGVVSEPVAIAMAQGAARAARAQLGVGISGIAGPGGGTPQKPVGTVCFGFTVDGATHGATVHFGDLGRNAVRDAAVEYVYDTLLELLR